MVSTAMTAPGFTEEWFSPLSQEVLADLGRRAPAGEIVEIGSWEGRSTVALANAVYPRIVHCVDRWTGLAGYREQPVDRDVFAQFQTNIAAYTKGNVVAHRMDWRMYTPEGPVGLVFIDAEHTRVEVRDNIIAYRPLMVPGGIMCGDDVAWHEVREGVFDVLPIDDLGVHASLWIWENL